MSKPDPSAQALAAVFDARNPDGTFLYSDVDVRHYLPLLILTAKIPFTSLNEPTAQIVGQFVVDAKLDVTRPPAEVQAKIEAYYAASPVNKALHKALLAVVQGVLAGGGEAAAATLTALGMANTTGVVGGGERPTGTTPGGPLARFATVPPKKK